MATGRVPTTANSPLTAKGDLFGYSTTQARVAVGNDGETLVADSSTSTGLRYQGNVAGGKNVIINGGFDIWQRGTSFSSSGDSKYTADRYSFQTQTGGTATQDTTSLPNGFRYGWKFTATATNTYMQSGTQIEFQNMENLQNNTVIISFYAKANNANAASTALTVRTRTSATVDAAVLFSGTNTDTSVTLTTSYVRYFVTRTFTTFGAVSLEFVLGSTTASGDGFTITGIQMELGSVATAFSKAGGTLQGELAACQRYYYRNYSTTSTNFGWFGVMGTGASSTSISGFINHPVKMRVSPTSLDFQNLSWITAWGAGVTAISNAVINTTGTTDSAAIITLTTTGATAGQLYYILSNNGNNYIGLSAEL